MTNRHELRRIRATLDRTGVVPPDLLTGVVVEHLLERIAVYRPAESANYDRESAEAEACGWGMVCPGGNHRAGCPVAAGWEQAALRGLRDDPVRLWRPLDPDGWIGPPPPCYGKFLRGWFRRTA